MGCFLFTLPSAYSKSSHALNIALTNPWSWVRLGIDKLFKGSAYIEFSTEEEAKKFLDENKTLVWSPEITLTILPKADHVEETREQIKQKKEKFKEKSGKKENKEKGGSKKRKIEESEKEEKGEGEEGEKEKEEEKGEEKGDEKGDEPCEKQQSKDFFKAGLLIEATNIPPETSHIDVKALFAKFGKVRYVDFNKEKNNAIIRFFDPEPSKIAVAEMAEKKLEFGGNVIEGKLLEGEEEKKYWDEQILPRISSSRGGRGGKRGKGERGGKGGRAAKRRKVNTKEEQ